MSASKVSRGRRGRQRQRFQELAEVGDCLRADVAACVDAPMAVSGQRFGRTRDTLSSLLTFGSRNNALLPIDLSPHQPQRRAVCFRSCAHDWYAGPCAIPRFGRSFTARRSMMPPMTRRCTTST